MKVYCVEQQSKGSRIRPSTPDICPAVCAAAVSVLRLRRLDYRVGEWDKAFAQFLKVWGFQPSTARIADTTVA
jgi:hypothetical protein